MYTLITFIYPLDCLATNTSLLYVLLPLPPLPIHSTVYNHTVSLALSLPLNTLPLSSNISSALPPSSLKCTPTHSLHLSTHKCLLFYFPFSLYFHHHVAFCINTASSLFLLSTQQLLLLQKFFSICFLLY